MRGACERKRSRSGAHSAAEQTLHGTSLPTQPFGSRHPSSGLVDDPQNPVILLAFFTVSAGFVAPWLRLGQ
jgi:hypothetical protein